jgi:hypothetical protein
MPKTGLAAPRGLALRNRLRNREAEIRLVPTDFGHRNARGPRLLPGASLWGR